MSESKVQLGGKTDLFFVKNLLLEEALKAGKDLTPKENGKLDKLIKRVFDVVEKNVQVNGFDWDKADQGVEEFEPFDEKMFNELQDLQLETDSLLVHVTSHRREYPKQLLSMLQEKQEKEALIVTEAKENRRAIADEVVEPPNFSALEKTFSETVETVAGLKTDLPKLVDKMKRAASVMKDLPAMNQNPTEQLLQEEGRRAKKPKVATPSKESAPTSSKSAPSPSPRSKKGGAN